MNACQSACLRTYFSLVESLRASQVHQVELGDGILGQGVCVGPALHVEGEDAVRPGGVLVQGMLCYAPIRLSLEQ